MGNVFVSVGMSLDGYLAPEGMDAEHMDDPGHKNWMAKWGALQAWILDQQAFRQRLGFGEGGETGPDNELVEKTFGRIGANIMGKRMFDAGEVSWPEETPFHTPVFVLTNEIREPWERPGGTTFHFVNDGIESALRQARDVVGDKDIRISGGADVIRQYLDAGMVDEFHIALAPVLFGGGTPLFAGLDTDRFPFEIDSAIDSPKVTHLFYKASPA